MLSKLAKDTDLSEGVHVIKFFATWCGPCKLYAPAFERAAARFPEANFYEVDLDESPEIKDKYGVMAVPTTIIVENGEARSHMIGAKSSRQLDTLLTEVLDSRHGLLPRNSRPQR